MPNLRSALDSLAQSFASAVLDAIRGASLDELVGGTRGAARRGPGRPRGSSSAGSPKATTKAKTRSGRLARRSPEQIQKALDSIVALVKRHPKGLRSEEIRTALKLDVREVPRVLREGLSKKKLKSKGQRRATTYTAA